jgi:hypothetical protein
VIHVLDTFPPASTIGEAQIDSELVFAAAKHVDRLVAVVSTSGCWPAQNKFARHRFGATLMPLRFYSLFFIKLHGIAVSHVFR